MDGQPFSMTIDAHDVLWVHTLLDGVPFALRLGRKDPAFEIMTATMAACQVGDLPVSARDRSVDEEDKFDWE